LTGGSAPQLAALAIGDRPEQWAAFGFTVVEGRVWLGGVELRLTGDGGGIAAWTLAGVDPGPSEIDGLPTLIENMVTTTINPIRVEEHPNGAVGIDHVVVVTPDFDRTAVALEHSGLPLRRVRDAGGFRQGFRRLGPAIMEIVEATQGPPGPARFWGLTVTVADLPALADLLGSNLSEIRPAVQPGRHIATLRSSAGLSVRLAFMDPEPE
jgi:Glyoxalase-like domain